MYKMLNFVNACPITCMTVKVDRKEAPDKVSLSGKLAKTISVSMSEHEGYFIVLKRLLYIMIMVRVSLVRY